MTEAGQPPLPLAYSPRLGPAAFHVTDSNRVAVEWLADPSRWPMPRTLLIGPPQSGKSHLAALFATGHRGQVIDDADAVTDGEPLFHAWNAASLERPLLLTARRSPKFWAHGLADLASRLAATPVVRLEDPDDALVAAVIDKHFADRGLRVAPEVTAYLVARIERSFDAVADAVARLDALALADRRDITVPLARELLEGQLRVTL